MYRTVAALPCVTTAKKRKVEKMNTENISQKPMPTSMSESGELIVSVYNSQTGTMVEKKSSELTPKERERIVAQFRGED